MVKALDTVARRGGKTATRWHESTRSVEIETRQFAVRFNFYFSEATHRTTNVHVEIGPKDFPILFKAMCEIDKQKSLELMANELSKQIKTFRKRNN